jgi:hypothetical protein
MWELRATLSLADLLVASEALGESRQLLTSLCERFGQTQDLADLRDARALLQRIS